MKANALSVLANGKIDSGLIPTSSSKNSFLDGIFCIVSSAAILMQEALPQTLVFLDP